MQQLKDFRAQCLALRDRQHRELNKISPVWIFGAGQFGRDLCSVLHNRGYEVAGFIETKPKQREIEGYPVLNWLELDAPQRMMQLAIGIFNREMPMDNLQYLAHDAGFKEVLMPWHLYEQFGDDLGWRYWLGSSTLILNAFERIEKVYQNLSDDISKQCMLDILSFRLGINDLYASFKHDDNQYFNELTLPALQDIAINYIDGGAYNGDTYLELANISTISSAFLFEPDRENYNKLKTNVERFKNKTFCLPLALTASYSILSFNGDAGEGGAISDVGSQHIATVSLDEMLQQQAIDFIKLDVEGAEISAIKGASRLIRDSRPILAISLYHRPEDVWEIPELLLSLCDNYRFYIRQHYFNSFDSVFYAVPC